MVERVPKTWLMILQRTICLSDVLMLGAIWQVRRHRTHLCPLQFRHGLVSVHWYEALHVLFQASCTIAEATGV
jgi:hypothetical protein